MYYINVEGILQGNVQQTSHVLWPTLHMFSTGFSTSMTKLTASQCSDLIEQYVELCLDSMDHKSMYHFIEQTLIEDFENLSEDELLNEIECSFDTETLNELVGNVTTVTYGLNEGESISFPVHGT